MDHRYQVRRWDDRGNNGLSRNLTNDEDVDSLASQLSSSFVVAESRPRCLLIAYQAGRRGARSSSIAPHHTTAKRGGVVVVSISTFQRTRRRQYRSEKYPAGEGIDGDGDMRWHEGATAREIM